MSPDRIPKNGWLLYSRVTGEYQMVSPNLNSLSIAWTGMCERTRKMGSDKTDTVLCYELGSRMAVITRTTIQDLVSMDDETVQPGGQPGEERERT